VPNFDSIILIKYAFKMSGAQYDWIQNYERLKGRVLSRRQAGSAFSSGEVCVMSEKIAFLVNLC